jgi:hypothetical protein
LENPDLFWAKTNYFKSLHKLLQDGVTLQESYLLQ